ncbi:MAG TPA: T9SS type A sorting domain-containing protein [Ignavibacteriaceae bacterium]|nr:T9SS type A sorting domain-containing protein [Ignavibacteriaceae bacterium]
MKSLIQILFSFLLIPQISYAQSPDTIWTKIFATSGDDWGEYVEQTDDGGYIIAGTQNPEGSDNVWLIKTDANGDTLWTKTYGTYHYDYASCVHQTDDGGYIIFGETDSFDPNFFEGWLIKTNSSGDTLWTKHLGDYAYYFIEDGLELPGGGYVFVGYTKPGAGDPEDIWLVKTDANGDTLWTKTFGGLNRDLAFCVQHLANGDLIIGGVTESFGAGDMDAWVIKVNSSGDSVWSKTYGGAERDLIHNLRQTEDGGFIIAGSTESFGHMNNYTDAWLIKIDSDGDTVWTKTWGTEEMHDGAASVVQTSDGGYVFTGQLYINTFVQDLWILKTDADGNMLWSKNYGGIFYSSGRCINNTSEGSLIITGEYYNEVDNNYDIWLLNFDPNITGVERDKQAQIPKTVNLEQNYPNPFNPATKIKYTIPLNSQVQIKVFDVLGNEIATLINEEKPAGIYELTWNAANKPSGVYFYQLRSGSSVVTKKMILLM